MDGRPPSATTVRTAWFDGGAVPAADALSGAMAGAVLGALVDAGASPLDVADAVAALGLDDCALMFEPVACGDAVATHPVVVVMTAADHARLHDDGHGHVHHDPPSATLAELLDGADLPPAVLARARRVAGRLRDAAVPATEAILLVGTCAALAGLGIDRVISSTAAAANDELLRALADENGPQPSMSVTSTGRGVGSHDVTDANDALRVVVGDAPVPAG